MRRLGETTDDIKEMIQQLHVKYGVPYKELSFILADTSFRFWLVRKGLAYLNDFQKGELKTIYMIVKGLEDQRSVAGYIETLHRKAVRRHRVINKKYHSALAPIARNNCPLTTRIVNALADIEEQDRG